MDASRIVGCATAWSGATGAFDVVGVAPQADSRHAAARMVRKRGIGGLLWCVLTLARAEAACRLHRIDQDAPKAPSNIICAAVLAHVAAPVT
jgi:hypothetical protein